MFCLTPTFDHEPDFQGQGAKNGYIRLQYGFILDTVYTHVQNLPEGEHQFHLHPNPHYEQFEEKLKKYNGGEYLTINVRINALVITLQILGIIILSSY